MSKKFLCFGRSVLLTALAAFLSKGVMQTVKEGEPVYLSHAAPAMAAWAVALLSWIRGSGSSDAVAEAD